LPQVRRIARQLISNEMELEDLVSVGILGLIAAIDRFDARQGVRLETYVAYRIRGAMLDSLRALGWGSRYRRRTAKAIRAAANAAAQRCQGTPSEEDIAQELGVSVNEYRRLLLSIEGLRVEQADGGTLANVPTQDMVPSDLVERKELWEIVAEAIQTMPAAQGAILGLYYGEALTLKEIGERLGMSWAQVGGLKTRAIARLRAHVEAQWPVRGAMCPVYRGTEV
jgi:RNA polymerase sigma factor for flagellar operon FliA